jgi:heat-inducible transcriptional repressor
LAITCDDKQNEILEKISILEIDHAKMLVICLSDVGHIENKIFNITKIPNKELISAVQILNNRLVGKKIKEIPEMLNLIKPLLMQEIKRYEYIMHNFSEMFLRFVVPFEVTSGMQYLVNNKNYDLQKIKSIVHLISQGFPWQRFLNEGNEIKIGKEINKQCSELAIITQDLQ